MNRISKFQSMEGFSRNGFTKDVYKQLLAISTDRVSVREEERRRIAREIHDDIGQILVALGMDVSLLKQNLNRTAQIMTRSELTSEIQRIETQIHNALETLHRVIAELRPEVLNHLGLKGAIEWQALEFQVRTGIPVEIRSDFETITMKDPNDATAVFRIFQEALTNVGRHAKASRVETTIREDRKFFLMQIKDNGRGIDKTDLQKSTSFGLLGLKERVFLLHGELDIQGVPDQGTTVTVRIPRQLCKSAAE